MSCPENSIPHYDVPKTQVVICRSSGGYVPRTHNGSIHAASDCDRTFGKWRATAHLSATGFCSLSWCRPQ